MKKGGGLGKSKLSGKGIKNTIVKYLKAHLKNMLIGIMIPVILIIAVGAFVLGIFEEVIDKVGETISTITDFSTVDESDGAIIVNDVQVDTIINDIYE